MNPTYEHLHPRIAAVAERSADERITHIQSARWIGYTKAKAILNRLEDLFGRPRITRMPGMALIGGTNNGKTTLLNHFCARHPTVNEPSQEHARVPILKIQCPPGSDERRLYHALLDELQVPYRVAAKVEVKHHQLRTVLGQVGTRMLMFDEIHNALVVTANKQRHFLTVLKFISNDLKLPIVVAGTSEAHNVITTDPQISNRLHIYKLPRWNTGTELKRLLASFEKLLPLRKPSGLVQPALAEEILLLSGGLIGEMAEVLTQAAVLAIRRKAERITPSILGLVDHTPPSQRREIVPDDDDTGGVLESPPHNLDDVPEGQYQDDGDENEDGDEPGATPAVNS